MGDLEQRWPLPDVVAVVALARQGATVRRAEAALARERAAYELERAQRFPDLEYGVGVRWENNTGARDYLADVKIDLPVYDHNQGGVRAAQHGVERARAERAAAEADSTVAVTEIYYALVEADTRRGILYDEILPAARATFDAYRTAYESGSGKLDDMLDSRHRLAGAEVDYIDALVDYQRLLATLEGLIGTSVAALSSGGADEEPGLGAYFDGLDGGCFVLAGADGRVLRHDPERCRRRFSPCSTFKIPNSLIGLETGVIPDAQHVIAWDGKERERPELNHDHTLRSAIRDSVVWYYQELASRVGAERMQHWVDAIPYGNRDLSGGLTRFWLDSTLTISADEQVGFLRRLDAGTLPFSERSMAIVKEILVRGEWPGIVYRGKTGSARANDTHPDLGWYVGSVSRPEGTWVFATNISGDGAWGPQARRITERILRDRGVLPAGAN